LLKKKAAPAQVSTSLTSNSLPLASCLFVGLAREHPAWEIRCSHSGWGGMVVAGERQSEQTYQSFDAIVCVHKYACRGYFYIYFLTFLFLLFLLQLITVFPVGCWYKWNKIS
jgi:hypothetical protein